MNGLMRAVVEVWRWAKTTVIGLSVTWRNLFRSPITLQYPDQRLDLPVGYRGIPVLLSDEQGQLKCTSCEMCVKACPVSCITLVSHRGEDRKKVLDEYAIDATWCMYCGLCVEACPFDALAMSDQYELADFELKNLLFDKERLTTIGSRQTTDTINFGIKTGGEATR